jgi:acyl-CoA thioester hydrolase
MEQVDPFQPLIAELLQGFPVIVVQNVIWGEMDAYEHVNNVVYFRYFENSRLEYFRRLDWFTLEKETGIGPILATTQARFRRALTYPDTIAIGARLKEIGHDRFSLAHRIISRSQGQIVTEGEGTIVTYDHPRQQKVPMPDELRRRITQLESAPPA